LANHFEEQGRGHLGAITSVAGERGRPRNYTYGSAKGALTCYLQGIRSRVYGADIWVHNLKLGPVDTPMTVGHDKHALFGEKVRIARGIVRALSRRRHVVYLPRVWGWIMLVVRLLPEPIFQRFGFLAGR
jgi:short-subunit dehydrogenase